MGGASTKPGVFVELDELIELRDAARSMSPAPSESLGGLPVNRRASGLRRRVVDFDEVLASARTREVPSIGSRATGRDRPVLLVVDQRLCMFFGTNSVT